VSALATTQVLELTDSVRGEYCGKLLADFGAQVIKIEDPVHGSATRRMAPLADHGADPERSGLFAYLNTNKRSVALDLNSTNGQQDLMQLLQQVDVVICDRNRDWLTAMGLDQAQAQRHYPQLVVCSITPFGLQGNEKDSVHAEDLNAFHASGWGYHTPSAALAEQPPLKGAGRFLASFEAGLDAALCIVAAVYERQASAKGEFIDVSQQATLASRADYVLGQMIAGDMNVSNDRHAYDLHGPADIYACADGFVYLWMSAPAHWQALASLLDTPTWMDDFSADWLERDCTPARVATCRHHVGQWLLNQNKAVVAEAAQKLGLILVPVNNAADLLASPQYQYREFFTALTHPVLGTIDYPSVPYKLSRTPAKLTRAAPLLGQHTQATLQQSAMNREQPSASVAKSDTPSSNRGGPLAGVRVVELTKVWAGPYTGKQLAFLGAEVIRVESLDSLDVTRVYGVDDLNNAPGFKAVNPQKLSVQISMKSDAGRELMLKLLAEADVVVENLRPGAIARLGLGYEQVKAIKPDIVYVSMGMYGSEGPFSYQTGYAPCFAALGGLSSIVGYQGEAPSGMNIRYADSTFGCAAAYATSVALLHRRLTGEGQFIDVSAVETMTSMIGDAVMDYTLNGHIAESDSNRHAQMAPHGVYPCRDGEWLCLAVASEQAWQALAALVDAAQPDELPLASAADFNSLAGRQAQENYLHQRLAAWTQLHLAEDLVQQLQQCGVASSKSLSSLDLISDSTLWGRGFYQQVTNQQGQQRSILGPAWKMSRMAKVEEDAPNLGEHNTYVLGCILGLTPQQQQELSDTGVTR
jgi:crotonobetainyl-CoA:carnitine CoA-transferase CaiB-like acyl-CoA transferase